MFLVHILSPHEKFSLDQFYNCYTQEDEIIIDMFTPSPDCVHVCTYIMCRALITVVKFTFISSSCFDIHVGYQQKKQ